jgi:hypothetical protein
MRVKKRAAEVGGGMAGRPRFAAVNDAAGKS